MAPPSDPIDWSAVPRGFDGIVADLKALRLADGEPSYREIADRIVGRRARRGVPEHERRLARSTVYDCFRSGRKRVDLDLIAEIGAALGLSGERLDAWRDRIRRARAVDDAASVVPMRATTPEPVSDFVGRVGELARLEELFSSGSGRAWVDGQPGIGKSQLALRFLQQWEGDSLVVDLRGFQEGAAPVDPSAVQTTVLRRLGEPTVDDEKPVERAARLTAALARRGALLVLDDAHDARQVRGIVGASTDGAVLVTTRVAPPARWRRVAPKPFDDEESIALLRAHAPERAEKGEDAAMAELNAVVGGLPLALGMIIRRIETQPDWTLAEHVDVTRRRLERLHVDYEVQQTLELSFQTLSDAADCALRLMASMPVTTLDSDGIAALVDAERADADRIVDELTRANLAQLEAGRLGLHTLVRAYSSARSEERDRPGARREAFARLGWALTQRAWGAYDAVAKSTGTEARTTTYEFAPFPGDAQAADDWMTANLDTLLSIAHASPERGEPTLLFRISDGLSWWLHLRGIFTEALRLHEAAAEVAMRVGDLDAVATASLDAGQLLAARNHGGEALTLFRRAARLLGDGQGVSDPGIVGLMHNMIGVSLFALGRPGEAIEPFERAVEIHERLDQPNRLASALINLEVVLSRVGPEEDRGRVLERVIAIVVDNDLTLMHANALANRADLRLSSGRLEDAIADAESALEMATRIDVPFLQITASTTLAQALSRQGDPVQATPAAERAIEIARRYESSSALAEALTARAVIHAAVGEHERAVAVAREAQALVAPLDDPVDRGRVQELLGELATGDERTALWRKAISEYEAAGARSYVSRLRERLALSRRRMSRSTASV